MAVKDIFNIFKKKEPDSSVSVLDVLREIPESTIKVRNKIIEGAKDILQGIARQGGSVGLTLMSPFTGKEVLRDEDLSEPAKKIKHIIFGEDPIKTITARIAETEVKLKQSKIKSVREHALPLSVVGVAGSIALDFIPESKITKLGSSLSKIKDETEVALHLAKETNLSNKVINQIAPEIAKTTNRGKIEQILKGANVLEKSLGKGRKTRQFIESVREYDPETPLKIGGQYVPRDTDVLAVKARSLVEENIDKAEKIARKGDSDISVATASELIKHYSSLAQKSKDKVIRTSLYEKAAEIAQETAKSLTEHGRAVQAASILGRQTPEGFLRFAAKEINRYNEAVEKSPFKKLLKKAPQLSGEEVEALLSEFNRISKIENETEKAMAMHQLITALKKRIPTSLYKKIISLWKAGLLTGIKTSGLNILSTLGHSITETLKDIPATAVDITIKPFTGKRSVTFSFKGIKEAGKGLKEGAKKGWTFLKTGFDERDIGAKFDRTIISFGKGKVANALEKYEETIFRLLGAEDQPFYYAAKARSLYNQALVAAKNKGLKGKEAKNFVDNLLKNPTDEMLNNAVKDAEVAVFQNPTTLAKAAKAVQKIPGVGEIIVPFSKTPSSVVMQIINYTPAGIVSEIAKQIAKGEFNQKLLSEAIGRGITGSGLFYLGEKLFEKGLISLGYPKGRRERKQWELEGRKAFSIKDGDKWRSIAVFGPAGYILVMGAQFNKAKKETGSISQSLKQASLIGLKSAKEQSFLQGVNQLVSATEEPERFGERYFSNIAASVIPTIIKDVAVATDENQREPKGVLETIKSRIPGLRETTKPKIDVLGRVVGRGQNFIEAMIDPSRPSAIRNDEITKELRRLMDKGIAVTPTELGGYNGFKSLTPEENIQLQKRAGEILEPKLRKLINTKTYQNIPDDEKGKIIKEFTKIAYDMARAQAVMAKTEGLSGNELKQTLKQLKEDNLLTYDVFKMYALLTAKK